MYEVNYSSLAGVIRQNQPLDLTELFVGLDLATCAARQRLKTAPTSGVGAHAIELGRRLQRISGVLAAGTVPILGLPAIAFRKYLGTFIAVFTRFFADIATFILDKNGEELISAHIDRTMRTIGGAVTTDDRLVVAAHSLGSVVIHNYIVRQWASALRAQPVPDTVVTFGSPIGLLTWGWLFLDFEGMRFDKRLSADRYLCWNPVSNGTTVHKELSWINVVNCVDPIATAFPVQMVDLSAPEATIRAGLRGGTIAHRFFGPAKITAIGEAHVEYFNDKKGFLEILLRASGLAPGAPEDVPTMRSASEHWTSTRKTLAVAERILLGAAAVAIGSYCWIVAPTDLKVRGLWFVAPFLFPRLTIGFLTFFQRLFLGGPTKRIPLALIRQMAWSDPVSFPYRLRELMLSRFRETDVDPIAPSPGYVTRLAIKAISFAPTMVLMAIPITGMAWWSGRWPTATGSWAAFLSARTLEALVCFMIYVVCCALYELARIWRSVVQIVNEEPDKRAFWESSVPSLR
jgi:hypothetical protein